MLLHYDAIYTKESYVVNKKTTLKLKKNSILSVESDVLDSRGFYVFRKSGMTWSLSSLVG